MSRLAQTGACSVRQLGGTRAGEIRITRFLRNPKTGRQALLENERERCFAQASGRHILILQDTSTIKDLQKIGTGACVVAHPSLAVDATDGSILGLMSCEIIKRDQTSSTPKQKRVRTDKLALSDKQSARWLRSMQQAAPLLEQGARQVTMVADRESDIYACLAQRPKGIDFVIRSSGLRACDGSGLLKDFVQGLSEQGRMSVPIPAAPGRKARMVELSLCYSAVNLHRPRKNSRHRYPDDVPDTLPVYVLSAKEIGPLEGQPCASWLLITSHPIKTLEQAEEIIHIYRERWTIEQLFRTLKSKGFDIEACRVEADEPFERLVIMAMIMAARVMAMVKARDNQHAVPMRDHFTKEDTRLIQTLSKQLEGKTQKQQNPHPPDSLAFVSWVFARLGGWNCYYGKPGPIVLYNGMIRYYTMKRGYKAFDGKTVIGEYV